jgi:RNA polymerase sigma factor (sigma-70 family)
MPAHATRGVLAALARAEAADPTDADLVRRFATTRDEAAFAELVRRYGSLVLGVCRRLVPDYHLADDAFQAVFVVLATKANGLDSSRPLGPWLYAVASRVAFRARTRIGRQGRRESTLAVVPDMATATPVHQDPDSSAVLDEEIGKLSAAYRQAIVLCELEGLSRKEAARKLGIPEGTVSSRLAAARKILAARLARRGVVLPATLALAVSVPPNLAEGAVRSAVGSASGIVLELSREVLRAMLISKLKLVLCAAAVVIAVVLPFTAILPFAATQYPAATAAPMPKAEPHQDLIVVTQPNIDKTVAVLDAEGKPAGELNPGNIRSAYTPRVSPDGKRVALLTYIDPEVGIGTSWPSFALMVFDLNAKDSPGKVLVDRVRCPSFAWSPDGKKLYVSSIPKEKLRVADNVDQVVPVRTRVYDAAGGHDADAGAATDIPEGHGVSAVAPDGKSVLTTVQVKDPDFERLTNHIVPLDTLKPTPLAKEGYFEPRFSPDGTRVLGVRRQLSSSPDKGLFVFDVAKKQETRITLPKELQGAPLERARWSPEGKRLLVEWTVPGGQPLGAAGAPRGGGLGGGGFLTRLSVADIDGSKVKQLAEYPAGEFISGIDWK